MTKIRLLTSQLLYDIRNIAYVEGHLLPDDTECHHRRHLVTDIGEDGNIDIVARSLLLAHAALQWALARANLAPGRYTDILTLPKTFVLPLTATLTHARATLLTQLAHEYMVACALAHWLSITHPEAAAKWQARATALESRLTSSATTHTPLTRASPPIP